MNLCQDGHDEVCFEGRNCPVCEKQKELDAANEDIAKLQDAITELKDSQ